MVLVLCEPFVKQVDLRESKEQCVGVASVADVFEATTGVVI